MKFIRSLDKFPFSAAVIHNGKVLETVLTGIPDGGNSPVSGGAGSEMREIFNQLDEILENEGLSKRNLCSARIYLQEVTRDVGEINTEWSNYLGDHPINRRCYGVELQNGMLVEACFVAEIPE
ncbi:MAG: Rid family hydrolase [SAR202 cluster bacterium]|nr:Rid family hydrolase [Dehalococcoidia bacterium]MDP7579674.1 Rid family hydrolase [SAR202 cluster bacterium]